MNNNLPLIIGAIIVAAVGGFLLFGRNNSDDGVIGGASPKNFAELMALGENYTCTFEDTDDAGNTTSGTVYVADRGERLNGDFTTVQADGETSQSYIIRDGEYNYIWGSDFESGFKSKIEPENNADLFPDTNDGKQSTIDENKEVDFDCQRWTVDNSLFVPPSNIEFVDFSEQMELMNEQMEEASQQMQDGVDCSVCEQIPAGQGRDQCLATLGC